MGRSRPGLRARCFLSRGDAAHRQRHRCERLAHPVGERRIADAIPHRARHPSAHWRAEVSVMATSRCADIMQRPGCSSNQSRGPPSQATRKPVSETRIGSRSVACSARWRAGSRWFAPFHSPRCRRSADSHLPMPGHCPRSTCGEGGPIRLAAIRRKGRRMTGGAVLRRGHPLHLPTRAGGLGASSNW